jgi:hypothetical protein
MGIIVTTTPTTPSAAIDIEWLVQNCYINLPMRIESTGMAAGTKIKTRMRIVFHTAYVRSAGAAGLTG